MESSLGFEFGDPANQRRETFQPRMSTVYSPSRDCFMKIVVALLAAFLITLSLRVAAQESAHFEFSGSLGGAPADTRARRERFEEIFEAVTERLGVSLDYTMTVTFAAPNPGPCRSRGATMVSPTGSEKDFPPRIFIFADGNTDPKEISAIWAHELGHALQYSAVEGGRSPGSIFIEGFATWAAGPYWLEWQGATSFQSLVASYIAAGTYLPLHENAFLDTLSEDAVSRFGDECLSRRDVIYSEWAAFIEDLVEQHGRERLYSLFQTPPLVSVEEQTRFTQPNFPAVYGSSLERLEAEWLERVARHHVVE
jgi:hypothetical protein